VPSCYFIGEAVEVQTFLPQSSTSECNDRRQGCVFTESKLIIKLATSSAGPTTGSSRRRSKAPARLNLESLGCGEEEMLEGLDAVSWDLLPQPNWNLRGEVPAALRGLASCATIDEAEKAYDRFLYAIGNNHAGTYFPVVLATLHFLREILESGSAISRDVVLDVLIDLTKSFELDVDFRSSDGSSNVPGVPTRLDDDVQMFADVAQTIATDRALPDRTRSLALELLATDGA
jgi:hypothetical protein